MNNLNNACSQYISIILSAGISSRMKKCKQLLQWGNSTVLSTIIASYKLVGVGEIIVVSGGFRELIENEAKKNSVQVIFNPEFNNGEMKDSLIIGLSAITKIDPEGVFIALGDQPMIMPKDILGMVALHQNDTRSIIIPSFNMKRGHPWLVPNRLIPELKSLAEGQTLRNFLWNHTLDIVYYDVEDSRILEDLDTPEEYEKYRPK
jgi:molybdenum cofactor cytidylyltransferase